MTPRYAQVDGVRLHYVQEGDGLPLVLLPGLGSSIACSWTRILPHLTQDFQVLALDLPGSGDSDKPVRNYDLRYAVEAAVGFLDALGLETADFMGTSAGGLVALSAALSHPKRVRRLVLAAPAGLGPDVNWGLRLAALPLLWRVSTAPWPWLVRRSLFANFVDPALITAELVQEYCRVRALPGAQAALCSALRNALSLRGLRRELVLRERLGEVKCPAMVLWGDRDQVLPVSHAAVARELIPDCRVHILENTGHDPAVERPAEVARLVREFLRSPLSLEGEDRDSSLRSS